MKGDWLAGAALRYIRIDVTSVQKRVHSRLTGSHRKCALIVDDHVLEALT